MSQQGNTDPQDSANVPLEVLQSPNPDGLTVTEQLLIAAYRNNDWQTMGRLIAEAVPQLDQDEDIPFEVNEPAPAKPLPSERRHENIHTKYSDNHIGFAWWLYGALVGNDIIRLPEFDNRNSRWHDFTESHVLFIAQLLAEFD